MIALLSISAMKRIGVFERPGETQCIGYADCTLEVCYFPSVSRIYVMAHYPGGERPNFITIVRSELRYGPRWDLQCPQCGKRCSAVAILPDQVVCTAQFVSAMANSFREERERWLTEQRWQEKYLADGRRDQSAFERNLQHYKLQAKLVREPPSKKSTTKAGWSYCCEASGSYPAALKYNNVLHYYLSTENIVYDPRMRILNASRPDRPMSADDYPSLVACEVALPVVHSYYSELTLPYRVSNAEPFPGRIFTATFYRDKSWVFGIAVIEAGKTVAYQELRLTPRVGRGRQLAFICPVFGKPCERIYFRNGAFASREAQRLYHASQRVPQR